MENINKYVLGILHKEDNHNEIHAVPLTGIVQMRPSFSYFDKSDKRQKAEQKAENEADLDEEEPTQITVKFARQENDNVRKAREKSFNFLSKKYADEAWCETMWYPKDSHQAELERQKLFTAMSQPSSKYNEGEVDGLIISKCVTSMQALSTPDSMRSFIFSR